MMYWHDDPTTHPPLGTRMWHIHHDQLVECLLEPLEDRLRYIRTYKSEKEIPIRLALIDIVKGVPKALNRARVAMEKASKVFDAKYAARNKLYKDYINSYDNNKKEQIIKAKEKYNKAYDKFIAADKIYREKEMAYFQLEYNIDWEALHKIEHPNCPWNGYTIFPRDNGF